MRIEFADDDVAQICTDQAHKLGLPFAVIKSARRKLIQMEAAPDDRTLRNLKGLNYKQRQNSPEGFRTIRVNDQYRIVFTISEGQKPPVITVYKICDTH